MERFAAAGIGLTELSLHLPSLDEVFLTLTGRPVDTATEHRPAGARSMSHLDPRPTPRPRRRRRCPRQPRGGLGRYLRHALVLARRSLVKTWRTPEALIDVTVQPVIFLALFTYIFGGAIAGGDRGAYLQFLLPGHPRPVHRAGRDRARA